MRIRKIKRLFLYFFLAIFVLILIAPFATYFNPLQPRITSAVCDQLNNNLGFTCEINKVVVPYYNKIRIQNLRVYDPLCQTSIEIEEVLVRVSLFQALFKKGKVRLELSDGWVDINPKSFKGPGKEKKKKDGPVTEKSKWKFIADQVDLENITFRLLDTLDHVLLDVYTGSLRLDDSKYWLSTNLLEPGKINIANTCVSLHIADKPSKQENVNGNDFSMLLGESRIALKNVSFDMQIDPGKVYLASDIGKLGVALNSIDFGKQVIDVKKVLISELYHYQHFMPDTLSMKDTTEQGLSWSISNKRLSIKKMHLVHRSGKGDTLIREFNHNYMLLSDMQFSGKNFHIDSTQLKGEIDKLQGMSSNSYTIDRLNAKLEASDESGTSLKLKYRAGEEHIKVDLAFTSNHYYRPELPILQPFDLNVESSLKEKTPEYFLKPYLDEQLHSLIKNLDASVHLNGKGNNQVGIETFRLASQDYGEFSLQGEVQHPMNFEQINGNVQMTGVIEPVAFSFFNLHDSILTQDLGSIHWQASAEGDRQKIDAWTEVQTSLGTISGSGLMNQHDNKKQIETNLRLDQLKLSKLFDDEQLPDFSASLNAKACLCDTPQVSYEFVTDSLFYNNYYYTGIVTRGELIDSLIHGDLKIDDPNLKTDIIYSAELTADKKIHLEGKVETDLHDIGFINDSLSFVTNLDATAYLYETGEIDGKASFTNVDVEVGQNKAKEKKIEFDFSAHDSIQLKIISDILTLDFVTRDNMKEVATWKAQANEFRSTYNPGQYNLDSLILPWFVLNLHSDWDPVLSLFFNSADKFHFESFDCKLNTDTSRLMLDIDGRGLTYKGRFIQDLQIDANGIPAQFKYYIALLGTEFHTAEITEIKVDGSHTSGLLEANFFATNGKLQRGNIVPLTFQYKDSSYLVRPASDHFVFHDTLWRVDPSYYLAFSHRGIDSILFHLEKRQSKLSFVSTPECNLKLDITNYDLQGISRTIFSDSLFSGIINCESCISMNGALRATLDMYFNDLVYRGFDYGEVDLRSTYTLDADSIVKASLDVTRNNEEKIELNASGYKKLKNKPTLEASIENVSVSALNFLIEEFVKDAQGVFSGEFYYHHEDKVPSARGVLSYQNLSFTPRVVNTPLRFDDNRIILSNRELNLNNIKAYDQRGKMLQIDGTLELTESGVPEIEALVRSDSIQLLNIPESRYRSLFGKVVASNDISMVGPLNSPKIEVDVEFVNGTDVTYKIIRDLAVHDGSDVVVFSSSESDTTGVSDSLEILSPEFNFDLDARISVNQKSRFGLKMNAGAEFDCEFFGNGKLNFRGRGDGTSTLNGTYAMTRGKAALRLQGLGKREFQILPGSNIRWSGLVNNPQVNIKSRYSVTGSYENPAGGSTQTIIAEYNVLLNIVGNIDQLQIQFDVQTDDDYMSAVLANMPEEDRLKQAINLLVMKTIITPESQGSSTNIITDQFNQFWANQLTEMASSSFSEVDVSVDIHSFKDYRDGRELDRTNLSYEVSREIWDEKATVKVGGYVSMYDDPKVNAPSRMIGDVSMEYKLDTLDTWYFKVFSEHKYEGIIEGEIQRTGAGVMYKKRYNKFGDIWRRKNKRMEKESNPKKEDKTNK